MIIAWYLIFRMANGIAITVMTFFHIYVTFLKPIARVLLVLHVLKQHVPHVHYIVKFLALMVGYITQKLDFVIK